MRGGVGSETTIAELGEAAPGIWYPMRGTHLDVVHLDATNVLRSRTEYQATSAVANDAGFSDKVFSLTLSPGFTVEDRMEGTVRVDVPQHKSICGNSTARWAEPLPLPLSPTADCFVLVNYEEYMVTGSFRGTCGGTRSGRCSWHVGRWTDRMAHGSRRAWLISDPVADPEQPQTSAPRMLNYSADGWRLSRRRRIRIVVAVLVAIVVVACIWPAANWLLLRIAFAQCRAYRAGPEEVTFSRAASPDQAVSARAVVLRETWTAVGGLDRAWGCVLSGRAGHAFGEARIVAVRWRVSYDNFSNAFDAFCVADGGVLGRPTSLDTVRTPRNGANVWSSDTGVRFYFGQADPADPTHFTIAYETLVNPGKGIIDGWLCEGRVHSHPVPHRPRCPDRNSNAPS